MTKLELLHRLQPNILPSVDFFWPPAMGYWYMLAFVVLCFVSCLALTRLRRGKKLKRRALEVLESCYQQDREHFLPVANQILKAFALQIYPECKVAPLNGSAWASFLQAHCAQPLDKKGLHALSHHYQKNSRFSADKVLLVAKTWIYNHV